MEKHKKTVYLLSLLTLVIVSFSSCEQDDGKSNRVEPKYTTRLEANLILVHYLELIGDEYVLNISLQEAKELGVSAEMYINAQNEIRETNEFIKKAKSEPGNEIHLTDPQEALRSAKSGDIVEEKATRGLPTLMGILQTSGQEEVQSNLTWAPSGTGRIRFLCRTNAALTPLYTCKTYSSGIWNARTTVGTSFTDTRIDVPLYVSNDFIKVAFQTSDSNGGRAVYEGYN